MRSGERGDNSVHESLSAVALPSSSPALDQGVEVSTSLRQHHRVAQHEGEITDRNHTTGSSRRRTVEQVKETSRIDMPGWPDVRDSAGTSDPAGTGENLQTPGWPTESCERAVQRNAGTSTMQ